MPTSHPRVQVTLDPDLQAALRRAAPSLQARSRAAQLRELALLGAEGLDDFDAGRYAAAVEQLLQEDLPGLDDVVARRHADAS